MATGAPGTNLGGVRLRAARGGRRRRGPGDRVRGSRRGVRAHLAHRLRRAAPRSHGPDPAAPEVTGAASPAGRPPVLRQPRKVAPGRVWAVRGPGTMTALETPAWWIRGKGRCPELQSRRLLLFGPLHVTLGRRSLRVTT